MTRLQHAGALLFVCALAVIAYLPAQSLPFIADDYVQTQLGRDYGPLAAWPALMKDPLYRCRATSIPVTHWTEMLFGLEPLAYNLSSLLLHTANAVILYCFGLWPSIGWKRSLGMAAFFAVAEGHQEAVVWYAAIPELFVFFFSALSFLAFVMSVNGSKVRVRGYGASLACFILALASKESGVAVVAALAIACCVNRVPLRRAVALLSPYALIAAAYVFGIFWSSSEILHFHDGAFSLRAPVYMTVLTSAARMLWFWGAVAITMLAVYNRSAVRALVPTALCWMLIALVPYGFLSYMNRVPSRHTYLASAGLSLIVGAAFVTAVESRKKWLPVVAAFVVIVHNCGYLWTRKQAQYEQRARPTEELVQVYRRRPSKAAIQCFPYSMWIARYAIEIGAGAKWDERMWQVRPDCGREEVRVTVEN